MKKLTHFTKARIVKKEGEDDVETEYGEEVIIDLRDIKYNIERYATVFLGLIHEDDCEENDCDCEEYYIQDESNSNLLHEAEQRGFLISNKENDIVSHLLMKRLIEGFDYINKEELEEFLKKHKL